MVLMFGLGLGCCHPGGEVWPGSLSVVAGYSPRALQDLGASWYGEDFRNSHKVYIPSPLVHGHFRKHI